MPDPNALAIGLGNDGPVQLQLRYANRHGLIAGATGTGKTVTLQSLAEGFSNAGVPVFMADVKGDLSGVSQAGSPSEPITKRLAQIGITGFEHRGYPTVYWDLFGKQGHPIRTTVSEMGPLLLARLLELNDTQEGVLNIVFRIADEDGLLLLDLKDLRAILQWMAENTKAVSARYGNVTTTSIGAIQRRLLVLENQGAESFFGEPALDINELLRVDRQGYGLVNLLAADVLIQSPRLYATFLLWLLAELFEELPEVGDVQKPKLVFFFDEAHLLFDEAPKALLTKIEQVVRLIRSKGVGVYFVTQSPSDVPEDVLGQLGNRAQHALRAFTPKDQKAVRVAAETFRPNPAFRTDAVITELAVGEALVSVLGDKGVPSVVQRVLVQPPASRLGPVSAEERRAILAASPIGARYDKAVDRESAFELLNQRARAAAGNDAGDAAPPAGAPDADYAEPSARSERAAPRPRGREREGMMEMMAKSVVRTIGSSIGREIIRGVLGSFLRRR
jgi:DNA helicase HerA-like ATPase